MFRLAPFAAAALALAGCQQPAADATVEDAWVRLPAVPGNPGAAYFTIQGGSEPETLVAVRAPFALRAELHETLHRDGMMSMEALENLAIPANGTVAFAPGGKHVMIFDISPNVQPGTPVPLRLEFAGRDPIEVEAQVIAAGAEPER